MSHTLTIRDVTVNVGPLPKSGVNCYMLYAVDTLNISGTTPRGHHYLEHPIAVNVQTLQRAPTDGEAQEIIQQHIHCPDDLLVVSTRAWNYHRVACTFFCVNTSGEIILQLNHMCL